MKISEQESGQANVKGKIKADEHILPSGFKEELHRRKGVSRPKTSREEAIEVALGAVEQVPDIREDIVAELKAKIERGEYKVSGAEVADMMIRRMKADRIR